MRSVLPLLLILACDSPASSARSATGPLVAPDLWIAVEASEDLFEGHRPDAFRCPTQAYGAEASTFEVDTGECEYLAVAQPSLLPIEAGDTLVATIAHFPLVAAERATAHVALAVGPDVVWERQIPIPSDTRIYEFSWTASRRAPAGTPVQFHLHNHGSNNWFIGDISRPEGEGR